jgi:hypothetical protein
MKQFGYSSLNAACELPIRKTNTIAIAATDMMGSSFPMAEREIDTMKQLKINQ